jgi:thymidine kinase
MFIESNLPNSRKRGWIEVIAGSMFSGKTEELIRRLRRAEIARQKVEIFKPSVDVRYSATEVVSHDDNTIRSTAVENSATILLLAGDVDVVGIDEAQFFDLGLIDICNKLSNMGVRVVVAGLDMDFRGNPFGPVPGLMASAEYVTKVHAICMRCGSLAQFSHRLSDTEKLVVLGEKGEYEPLCRECYFDLGERN